MKSVPKLLPCAHCGSTDIHLNRMCVDDDGAISIGWHVECYECGMQTQVYPEDLFNTLDIDDYDFACTAMDDAVDCAIHAWNTRV